MPCSRRTLEITLKISIEPRVAAIRGNWHNFCGRGLEGLRETSTFVEFYYALWLFNPSKYLENRDRGKSSGNLWKWA